MADSNPPIIDAQVHVYERDHPSRPWVSRAMDHGPEQLTGADQIAAMDALGIAGALLVSPWAMYRWDPGYALVTAGEHPERFRAVVPVDITDAAVAEIAARWAAEESVVGLRLILRTEESFDATVTARAEAFFAEAGRADLPVALMTTEPPWVAALARAHPDVRFIIDHLGLVQPLRPPRPADPFARLPEVTRLAELPNVVVKVSGAPTLADDPFPFPSLTPVVRTLLDAFGVERCLWGSDWTRALDFASYRESLDYLRRAPGLSSAERALLLGGTAERVYGWRPEA